MSVVSKGKKILKDMGPRPPLENLYIYLLAAFIGFTVADLSILNFRPLMLPQKAPPAKPSKMRKTRPKSKSEFQSIAKRNIFNDDGKIPPALSSTENNDDSTEDAPAVPSKLPLKLLGTIVHVNKKKSVATINLQNKSKTKSYLGTENIEDLAEIVLIERRKITFRNLNNNRLEYLEIPEDTKISFKSKGPSKPSFGSKEIKKRGEFDFFVKRKDLEKYTSDLSSILSQARMVPNIIPGSGGTVEGFRFVTIEPDSIFSQLGFKPGDIIKNVDGDPVNSPTKAMEIYNQLKSSNHLRLGVERGGRDQDFNYTIE